ncbi:hypothetical protein [Streptacidiphilus sp. PAMC 29251]
MSIGQAYEVTGTVFTARTLLAFALGALAGALLRRTVPAMAATAAVWLALSWAFMTQIRQHLASLQTLPVDSPQLTSQGWVVDTWVRAPDGRTFGNKSQEFITLFQQAHGHGVTTGDDFTAWLGTHHYTQWATYQPASRFWQLQILETSSYLILAVIIAISAAAWIRRHAT